MLCCCLVRFPQVPLMYLHSCSLSVSEISTQAKSEEGISTVISVQSMITLVSLYFDLNDSSIFSTISSLPGQMLNDPCLRCEKLAHEITTLYTDSCNREVKSIREVTFKKSNPHPAKEKKKIDFVGVSFLGRPIFRIGVEFTSGLDSFRVYTKFPPGLK